MAQLAGTVRRPWIRTLFTPAAVLAAKRIKIENPADTLAMLRAEHEFDVRARLAEMTTETLVVCGARDYFWTVDMFTETAYRMLNARLVIYPRRGHALTVAPEFLRDVTAFLRGDRPDVA